MQTVDIDTGLIRRAAISLSQGGVIAYPTEGVWGLGCDPANEGAVRQLLQLKSRPVEKGLILVAGSLNQLSPFFASLPDIKSLLVEHDRPVTWVVNHGGYCPDWL